jgi:nucleoside-diphosphate-sugar epimerase
MSCTATVVGRVRSNLISESTPCVPISEYEHAKLEIEEALLSETKGALAATVVRPVAVFGEGGQNLVHLAQRVANSNSFGRRLLAYVHGMRCMNLVASDNVIAAITFLAKCAFGRLRGNLHRFR